MSGLFGLILAIVAIIFGIKDFDYISLIPLALMGIPTYYFVKGSKDPIRGWSTYLIADLQQMNVFKWFIWLFSCQLVTFSILYGIGLIFS